MATKEIKEPKTANEQLFDAFVRHQVYLMRYSGYIRNRITASLVGSEKALTALLREQLTGGNSLVSPSDYRKLERLQRMVQNTRAEGWQAAYSTWAQEMKELGPAEAASFQRITSTAAPVLLQTVLPAAASLRAIALSRPFQGRIMKQWAAKMQVDDLAVIMSSLQSGMSAGLTTDSIVRSIVGTAQLQGADGVLEMTRRQIATVTRTGVMSISAAARNEFLQENDDLFDEELFVATLDSRTTLVCMGNDGKVFKIGKGPMTPLHYNCRSLRVPFLGEGPMSDRPAKPVTQQQLYREFAEQNGLDPAPKSRDELPHGTKGQFDAFSRTRIRELTGQVPATTSYQDWMKTQSKEYQDDVLGKTKAKLFRDGDLKLDRFTDRNGNELTLPQLAKREAAAFKAAGLDPKDF